MSREVWFQLVGHDGNDLTSVSCVYSANDDKVFVVQEVVLTKVARALPPNVIASDLTFFANKTIKKDALVVEVPQLKRTVVTETTEVQWANLLSTLEWKEPKRLCTSSGQGWPYQGASELVDHIMGPLIKHYNAWLCGEEDKQNHALNLVLSGPGTGKSRMLDEMKGLLCTAATRSENQALMDRMKSAFVFHVTFENGTSATGSLLNHDFPETDISYRMLYQLSKEKYGKKWPHFLWQLKNNYSNLPLTIEKVIAILAHLKKINITDMTVILCVDGLQKLANDGSKTCDFYRVMTSVCSFLNSSTAFSVCVCSATVAIPVEFMISSSQQARTYLVPPALLGQKVLAPRSRLERQLVDDMGGHGRALEVLDEWLRQYDAAYVEKIDPSRAIDQVYYALRVKYGDVFKSALFGDPDFCKAVLAAILSRRKYAEAEVIGTEKNRVTVDELRSFGLFRLTSEGYLECAFILLLVLMRMHPKLIGEVDSSVDHLMASLLVWQNFEYFVAFYRRVKSTVFSHNQVTLSEFHAGARFGSIDNIFIEEVHPRRVVQATKQVNTKAISDETSCCTSRDGSIKVADMNTIFINGTSASAGDIFMRIQLAIGSEKTHCSEIIQCKLLQTKDKFARSTYDKEQQKAAKDSLDVFLLITPGEVTGDFDDLPPRCGIVSKKEFAQYFGPFASRAYRNLLDIPDLNTSSFEHLRLIEGVGEVTALKIVQERTKKRFANHEDAVGRLFSSKKCKTADILRAVHCGAVRPDSQLDASAHDFGK